MPSERNNQSTSPKENLLHVWRAVDSRSNQMRHHNLEFIEYIWLRRMCHNFDLLGLEQPPDHSGDIHTTPGSGSEMEELRNVSMTESDDDDSNNEAGKTSKQHSPMKYMCVFSFLDAIRLHKGVEEIERHRQGMTPTAKHKDSLHKGNVPTYSNTLPFIPSFSSPVPSCPVDVAEQDNDDSNSGNSTQQDASGSDTCAEKCGPSTSIVTGKSEYSYTYSYSDALKYAIMYSHLEYVQYLLEHHLEQALLDTVCCPLLLVAVRLDQPDIVEQLCYHSRRKEAHNYYIDKPGCSAMECGRTSLHVAAEMGNVIISKILLKYGANTHTKDDYGHTPLERVLFRLQSPHITNKTLKCVTELLKCQSTISASVISAVRRLLVSSSGTITESDESLVSQLQDIEPGPFSLKHVSRTAIRALVSYPNLPDGIITLDLPTSITNYLHLQD